MSPTNRDILASRKIAFATSSAQVNQWAQSGESSEEVVALVEQAINDAVDLIQALEVQAATPRHQHLPGDTHNHYDRKEFQSDVYVAQQTNVNGQAIENKVSVEVGHDRFYRLSADLILSCSGQMVIRPVSKKLITAVGEFDLNEGELSRLQSFLKLDYGV